ncbi:pentatricopeptide repeat-containing protein At3g13880 [Amborella trichopoda]|nr:pentatricopeptide repeat-containing protein At3g13880 [Amborella trichopoda]|eukprot:XP_006858486.2 pentatricopeptide repeat-containing protein At3g13880 [Amborella trichopoda]
MSSFCKYMIGFSECFFYFKITRKYTTSVSISLHEVGQAPFSLSTSGASLSYKDLLQACTRTKSLRDGKLIHAHLIKNSSRPKPCIFFQNLLLNLYCKCGPMDYAHHVFDSIDEPGTISWNALISGHSQLGNPQKAMEVFRQALVSNLKPDRFSFSLALGISSRTRDLKLGLAIHGLVILTGLDLPVFIANSLIDMYSKCGRVDQAQDIFDRVLEKEEVTWNTLVAGYVKNQLYIEALRVIASMHQASERMSSFVFGSGLKACSEVGHKFGVQLHSCILQLGLDSCVIVGCALLNMYSRAGLLGHARIAFGSILYPNAITYNAMMAGFLRQVSEPNGDGLGLVREAVMLFSEMRAQGVEPTSFTYSSLLRACSEMSSSGLGRQAHGLVLKSQLGSDEFIGSAIVDMYSKARDVEDGAKWFNSMPKQDVVLWTSMISGYVLNTRFEEALRLFKGLVQCGGPRPDHYATSSALSACAELCVCRGCEQLHACVTKSGLAGFTPIINALICAYAKAGDANLASRAFDEAPVPDVVTWSALIMAYAHHGQAHDALALFNEMCGSTVAPNQVSFLSVLTACSHAGLVDSGLGLFKSMTKDHKLEPSEKHVACVVDLLGRASRLSEAKEFILSSGFENDPVLWKALLGASRVHKDLTMAQYAGEWVMRLEPMASASYVLLYNMYMEAGLHDQAMMIRELMGSRGVKKEPGLSWIEASGSVHGFVVGDRGHPRTNAIYEKLETLFSEIEVAGYVPEAVGIGSYGRDKEGKENPARYHSEKLAVVFGMISLPEGAPIKVMKNLRICGDCHVVMKFISKVTSREIILRDAIRFHHFKAGSCSCSDYW